MRPDSDDHLQKVDKRYRESDYFLSDQLRYSETVQEFRSIKRSLTQSGLFQSSAFAFIRAR